MPKVTRDTLDVLLLRVRRDAAKDMEILVLRHQLAVVANSARDVRGGRFVALACVSPAQAGLSTRRANETHLSLVVSRQPTSARRITIVL